MITLIARHPVADYDAWRTVFDEFYPVRVKAGVIGESVYRSIDDPNEVTVVLDFSTEEAARAFPDNTEIKGATHKAGDIGTFTQWFAAKE